MGKSKAAPEKAADKKAKKDEETEDSTRKDLNATLNGLKHRRDKKGETDASKILEVGPHKNKSTLTWKVYL